MKEKQYLEWNQHTSTNIYDTRRQKGNIKLSTLMKQ